MKEFEYVSKKEWMPVKKDLIELINMVQNEIRSEFTFSFDFIGSSSRNMITREKNGNKGYDFDVNIKPNDDENKYSPKRLKNILMNGLNKHNKRFEYDFCEDSKRVITIKIKDKKNSKIVHSCDFAIVHNYVDDDNDCQEFVYFNKKQNTYEWQSQPQGYYNQTERIEWLKKKNLWRDVKELYLEKKCKYGDNKKSRQIFAETVNEVAMKNGYDD